MGTEETKAKLDQIVAYYIKLRDDKAAAKKKYDLEVEALDKGMEKIENFLLRQLQESGAESVRTAEGTFFKKTVTRASVIPEEWESTLEFIKEHDMWNLLERRVSKSAVQQYREEHNDIPPGINWTEILSIEVRRA